MKTLQMILQQNTLMGNGQSEM